MQKWGGSKEECRVEVEGSWVEGRVEEEGSRVEGRVEEHRSPGREAGLEGPGADRKFFRK